MHPLKIWCKVTAIFLYVHAKNTPFIRQKYAKIKMHLIPFLKFGAKLQLFFQLNVILLVMFRLWENLIR